MATAMEETTDLLQHLIRNECVNDGTLSSGHEVRSADTLASYVAVRGADGIVVFDGVGELGRASCRERVSIDV